MGIFYPLKYETATRGFACALATPPTAAHFLIGQVLPDCYDLEKAKESLAEMYEVADLIIPGHDNIFTTPRTM